AFQQKCADAFYRMKDEGKTIVLVTHEMATVEDYCHRAMLIDGGKITQIGDPAETGQAYLRLNFERGVDTGAGSHTVAEGGRLLDAWVEASDGGRVTSVEPGNRLNLRMRIEVERDISHPEVGLVLANADGLGLFQFGTSIEVENDSGVLAAGR